MPQVDFYHLTSSDMAEALVMLVKKCQVAGKRALIQCPRPAWIMSEPAGNPIDAEFLFLLHGAERPDMASFERVFNLFDGRSDAQVSQARAQWQEWRQDESLEMRYFAQDDDGKWGKRG